MSVKVPQKSTFFNENKAGSIVKEVSDKESIMDQEISDIKIS